MLTNRPSIDRWISLLAIQDTVIKINTRKKRKAMTRNVLFLVIGALAVATAVFGYQLYQERQKSGIEISVGKSGISIEKK